MTDTPRTDAVCSRKPANLRASADMNENDPEVGKGIADAQREHANPIEFARDLERELALVRARGEIWMRLAELRETALRTVAEELRMRDFPTVADTILENDRKHIREAYQPAAEGEGRE